MVAARHRLRIAEQGTIVLPADLMSRHHLQAGDEVAVEDTGRGLLIVPHREHVAESTGRRFPIADVDATPEEIALREAAVDRVLALRRKTPSIAPLTTADLVRMSRDDAFWYGDEAR